MKKIIVFFFCVTSSSYSMQTETKIIIKRIPFEEINQTKYQIFENEEIKGEILIQKFDDKVLIKYLDDLTPMFGYERLCEILLQQIITDNKSHNLIAKQILSKHWPYFDKCHFTSNKDKDNFTILPDDNDK